MRQQRKGLKVTKKTGKRLMRQQRKGLKVGEKTEKRLKMPQTENLHFLHKSAKTDTHKGTFTITIRFPKNSKNFTNRKLEI